MEETGLAHGEINIQGVVQVVFRLTLYGLNRLAGLKSLAPIAWSSSSIPMMERSP